MRSCLARLAAARSSLALLLVLMAVIGTFALLAPAAALAAADPAKQAAAAAPADAQAKAKADAAMEVYMKLAQPGEHHKRLDNFAGKWKVAGKAWMDPNQPATEFTGTVDASWLLGGRYLQSVHKGSFSGMPFEGRAIDGYDNATHEYFSTWIDNMGTGVMVFRGSCEDPCKVLTTTAESFDSMAGKVIKSKEVTTYVDPDTYRFEMYIVGATPDSKDVKVMELVSKRDK